MCCFPVACTHRGTGLSRSNKRFYRTIRPKACQRLCTPRARPASPRTGAGPDGRAGSMALCSAAWGPPACAAGLMRSTRAHGAGIAAIAAIWQARKRGSWLRIVTKLSRDRGNGSLRSRSSTHTPFPGSFVSTFLPPSPKKTPHGGPGLAQRKKQ